MEGFPIASHKGDGEEGGEVVREKPGWVDSLGVVILEGPEKFAP